MQQSDSLTTNDMSFDQWFELLCLSLKQDDVTYKHGTLPRFPDNTTQINTVGMAGKDTLREANIFFQDCVEHFQKSSNWFKRDKRLIDFGCGWGRIARFFLRDFEPQYIAGFDVEEGLLDICRSTFSGVEFHKCEPFPPTHLGERSTDFIVGYSVFSHLSEEACHYWMEEFARILRPGGMVAITTRGRPFFGYCRSLKGQATSGYIAALAALFPDFDVAKRRYDAGEFVHSNVLGVSGGGALTSQFYGESFIPKKYAQDILSRYLEFDEFIFEQSRQEHPIMCFRKT